ncbi:family 20 glycosylhydrolase [Carboxylicivirga mesophila]|uniref:beta-N-acetylhexosaminidase n=1 Tax=Carboxylicivirga mesophila TaxID=1166478 RepID=A0ABS5KA17_9BACT|nr:family 20 glycosylhydrolase [Carboxylicivirga mesophila]MBS2211804.1 family 20 glycosylhydrolase [Carboxylicivirga mesophila]
MKQLHMLLFVGSLLFLVACNNKEADKTPLIPLPNSIHYHSDAFVLTNKTQIVIEQADLLPGIEAFNERIARHCKNKLKITDNALAKSNITINFNGQLPDEGYKLEVGSAGVIVEASGAKGVYYALQTFLQMCPELLVDGEKSQFSYAVKGASIEDSPQFAWRGMMLDVSRHFFTKEEVMELIDYLAFHKINVFHWHLVDDQGWRIEIKKYPKLTEVGAWRVDREHLPWNARPAMQAGEEATYGGYYTQEDIKEVVAYAQKRFITVVPEIEMPGHTTSSLAAYPEYSCTGGPFNVVPGGLWPITDIYCAGKDETFGFIEDILTEVMELFPSKYIHIGGDEANKAEWEKCAKCQARIKSEKLADEHALQSYFIKRVEKFLMANDRVLIGWDEILEGGLAPNATVMSWRGFHGGIEAAQSGHDVVMTPTSHCYLDYYQGPMDTEPVAFNGYIPLEKVYQFNPVPAELSAESAKHILGGQGNLWTEHVPTKEHMQYMTFPRMAAMAEALWTNAETRNWSDFTTRIGQMTQSYDVMGLNYAKSMYTVQFESVFNAKNKTIALELNTEIPDADIYYTLDGTQPDLSSNHYSGAIDINSSVEVVAASFINGKQAGKDARVNFSLHLATAKPLRYEKQPSDKYPGLTDITLVNSLRGSRNFNDGNWQGFEGDDVDVVIDLNKVEDLTKVTVGCLHQTGSWIFLPQQVKVQTSLDGELFTEAGATINNIPLQSEDQVMDFTVDISGTTARYVKVTVVNQGMLPSWHGAAGSKAWLFVDEIIVE